ncbi:lipid A export ATP-binding/permease msbA [Colletotrichum somersetense]|nr:lipid A export ATP-binding/permease msbA [Colletotrichum somersetense]
MSAVREAIAESEEDSEGISGKRHSITRPIINTQTGREVAFRNYLRVFSYVNRFQYSLMVAAAIASVGVGTISPLMSVIFGKLVNNFTTFDSFNCESSDPSSFRHTLNQLSLYMLILFLFRFALNYTSKFCFRLIGIRISAAIRLDFLASLFAQSLHVLDSLPSGSAAETITSTANTLQLGIAEQLGTILDSISTIITALIVAMTWSWELTLVTATVMVFLGLVIAGTFPFIVKGTSQQTNAAAKANSVANEAFHSIRVVAAYGAQKRIVLRYSEWVNKTKQFGQSTAPFLAAQLGLLSFGIYAGFALAFWYGTTKMAVEKRVSDAGPIVIVLMSVMLIASSLNRMAAPLIAVSKAIVAANEFFNVIDAPRPDPGTIKEPQVSATQDIDFSGVTFAYPSRPQVKVLSNLSLRFPSGKVTAIVGPSGSGKSTIVGLIQRWYSLKPEHTLAKPVAEGNDQEKDENPNGEKQGAHVGNDCFPASRKTDDPIQLQGSVLTCGHNLDNIDIKWWRSQIGLVQQDPFLFNDTIEKNIMYGLIGSEFETESEERKKELCRKACVEAFAHEFISQLPEGYQTQVGDSGTKLSGGQKQRIAIARSIIKRPKILILDEATSAIDARGERIVQAALEKASQNRTTITIAHRLSTVKSADKIIVMKNGIAVEQGTHDSLLSDEKGVYSGLVKAQQLFLDDDNSDSEKLSGDAPEERPARESSTTLSGREEANANPAWKKRGLFRSFVKLLAEQKSLWPVYGISIIAALVAGSVVPLQAWLYAKVIVIFQNPSTDKYLSDGAFDSLLWFVLALGNGFAFFFLTYSAVHCQHAISAVYKQQYFRSLLHQQIGFFDDKANSTGSLTARVASDPKQIEELFGVNLATVYSSVFGLFGALALAFAFSWKLAVVAFCVTIPLGFAASYFRFRSELDFAKMDAEVFAESSRWASESIGAFRTVSALTLENVITSRYATLLSDHVTKAYVKARFSTIIFALGDSMNLACQALIFWYGGHLILQGEIGIASFLVCYSAAIHGAEATGNALSFGPNAAQAAAASDRVMSTRASVEKDLNKTKGSGVMPDAKGGVEIQFRNVTFKYPTRDVNVLKGLNLTVGKGQFVGLVGASGAGKSSIISLLQRFYDVGEGEILFNNTPITDLDVFQYRKLMSLVAQEATLFQGSIKDNILIGVDPTTVTEARLHEVCRDVSIHDFIISLPNGYHTDIGSKGVSLSGGQRQRIAIARALIRDPAVLLLDEATSSLDSNTERLVQATFDRAAKGRTTVAVAHRLATIQNADLIYVLGDGRVLEQGNHAELLKKRGAYWHICQSQALSRN